MKLVCPTYAPSILLTIGACLLLGAGNTALAQAKPVAPAAPAVTKPSPAQKQKESKARHVDADGAEKLLRKDSKAVVLDVRTPGEFAEGHIANARNVDFNAPSFAAEVEKLDHSKTYLVHCAAGGRSTRSLEVFKKLGFSSIVHLDGGFNAWTKAGKPVAK